MKAAKTQSVRRTSCRILAKGFVKEWDQLNIERDLTLLYSSAVSLSCSSAFCSPHGTKRAAPSSESKFERGRGLIDPIKREDEAAALAHEPQYCGWPRKPYVIGGCCAVSDLVQIWTLGHISPDYSQLHPPGGPVDGVPLAFFVWFLNLGEDCRIDRMMRRKETARR